MAEKQQKFEVEIPDSFDETDRLKLGQLIIDSIKERTLSGLDRQNAKFKPYSEAYINSLEFKLAGKSPNEVNLYLTGNMLETLQILEQSTGKVTIGYEAGSQENDKAAWAKADDNGPVRDFLGLPPKTLNLLIDQIKIEQPVSIAKLADDEDIYTKVIQPDVKSTTKKRIAGVVSQSLVDNILKNIGLDEE